jgi:hypothetical protein
MQQQPQEIMIENQMESVAPAVMAAPKSGKKGRPTGAGKKAKKATVPIAGEVAEGTLASVPASNPGSTAGTETKKTKKRDYEQWDTYICTLRDTELRYIGGMVEKNKKPWAHVKNVMIKRKSFAIFNSLINQFLLKYGEAAASLLQRPRGNHKKGKATLTADDMKLACKLVLGCVAGNYSLEMSAIEAGKKAVAQYHASVEASAESNLANKEMAVILPDGSVAKKKRAESVTKTKRAGTIFPVGRIARRLKCMRLAKCFSPDAAMFAAGVMDELMAFVVNDTLHVALEALKGKPNLTGVQIKPRHIMHVIQNDILFQRIWPGTIHAGGVQLMIQPALLPEKHRKRAYEALAETRRFVIESGTSKKKEKMSQKGQSGQSAQQGQGHGQGQGQGTAVKKRKVEQVEGAKSTKKSTTGKKSNASNSTNSTNSNAPKTKKLKKSTKNTNMPSVSRLRKSNTKIEIAANQQQPPAVEDVLVAASA